MSCIVTKLYNIYRQVNATGCLNTELKKVSTSDETVVISTNKCCKFRLPTKEMRVQQTGQKFHFNTTTRILS
jgi:hypothetical protein